MVLRGDVAAACKNPGQKCTRRNQCCSKLCKGKKGKKRCRCKTLGASCPLGFAARCCGDLICSQTHQTNCSQGSVCCVLLGDEGCTAACDCCGQNPTCQNGRCCLPNGAPNCQSLPAASCCSGNCENNGCVP
jgi:hypothetical protein